MKQKWEKANKVRRNQIKKLQSNNKLNKKPIMIYDKKLMASGPLAPPQARKENICTHTKLIQMTTDKATNPKPDNRPKLRHSKSNKDV